MHLITIVTWIWIWWRYWYNRLIDYFSSDRSKFRDRDFRNVAGLYTIEPANCGLLTHFPRTVPCRAYLHPALTVSRTTRPSVRVSRLSERTNNTGPVSRRHNGGKGSGRHSLRFSGVITEGLVTGKLAHLHPASIHPRGVATGYWPYDMLTNIPIFWEDRLSTWTCSHQPGQRRSLRSWRGKTRLSINVS